MIFQSVSELDDNLLEVVALSDEDIEIKDQQKLLEFGIDYLIYSAILSEDATVRHLCRVYIRKLAKQLDVFPSSIHPLYKAIGEGQVSGFTVPAMNMREGITYDVARVIFKNALETSTSTFIFEIARSETTYTSQNQDDIAVCVLAAAIKEGYTGPVFLQGDHYQFNAEKYKEYPQGQIDEIELAIKDALVAGFYNIDIDASTLVDLSLPTKEEQQKVNYEITALLTKFIRGMQPAGVTVTIGGEIGHIGDVNSDVADFEAFMKGYIENVGNAEIISKVSVQTGTSHGGIPNPDGTIKEVSVDLTVLKEVSDMAREKFKMAGAVQHGASTLPNEMFGKFPEVGTVEIHLATGFLNILFETLPVELRDKMYAYINEKYSAEREEGWTDEQFMYKLRKKTIGPFLKDLWLISESDKDVIREALSREISILFQKLNIIGTSHTVRQYIKES